MKPKKRRKKKKVPSTPLVCGVKIKTIIGQNGKILMGIINVLGNFGLWLVSHITV